MVRPSPEFFLLMFALFKAGAVPVLVDPGIDKRALKQCLDEAQPQAFIGIPLAQAARVLLHWARSASLVVDLSATQFLDSTAMGALVALANQLRAAGGTLYLVAVPQPVAALLALVKLDRFFEDLK